MSSRRLAGRVARCMTWRGAGRVGRMLVRVAVRMGQGVSSVGTGREVHQLVADQTSYITTA